MDGRAWAVAVGRVVAMVVSALSGAVVLWTGWLVVGAMLADPASARDAHGYTRIFGSGLMVLASLALAAALPFTAPPEHRTARRVTAWTAVAVVVLAIGLAFLALVVMDDPYPVGTTPSP